MNAAVLFDVQQASLGYQQRAILHGLNLRIHAGEKVALLGESGAGKTTLLRHLRTLRPDEVAWCPQHSGLVPMLSVFHNIYMGRLDRHSLLYNLANLLHPLQQPRQDIQRIAADVGLQEYLFTSVEKLSGGQQSRTNLARALYQQRAVFIGDEPVSAVDELQADQLMALICARHDTVVVALHDVELALRHCTRIVGLRAGVIELDQPAAGSSAATLCRLYAAT
jgi:phosphonate transport system ATP-binding protein